MKVAKMLLLLLLEVFGCLPRVEQLPQSAGGAGRGKARLGSSLEFCSMFLGVDIHTYTEARTHVRHFYAVQHRSAEKLSFCMDLLRFSNTAAFVIGTLLLGFSLFLLTPPRWLHSRSEAATSRRCGHFSGFCFKAFWRFESFL